MILKHYANLKCGQTHYRRAGSGQSVVMLHASPLSSDFMVPLIEHFSAHVDVISPDTPGYGNSDAFQDDRLSRDSDLMPYVEWLREFLDELGLDKAVVYGSATGAQIAIEFAKVYPERLNKVVLENAAHFTDDERAEILEHYFPSISPQADGRHLSETWDMVNAVFKWFPWFSQDDEHLVNEATMPAEFIHAATMAYLRAGDGYDEAYRRAFANESIERVLPITVPVSVIRWQGSIIKKYVDRFDDFAMPQNIVMEHCESGNGARLDALSRAFGLQASKTN